MDERDVGRPFFLSKIPSSRPTVAIAGDETPMGFMPRKNSENSSPNKVTPRSSLNSIPQSDKIRQTGTVKRKVALQDKQLPISRPILVEDTDSISNESPRAAPKSVGLASLDSNSSIASMASNRKYRPAPIQVPSFRDSESRDSIVLDKTVSPPAASPPSTPPLPDLELDKEWEGTK